MELVILLGAPGSGKGTVCSRVAAAAGFVHLSTGDRLREAVKSGSAVGLQARDYMERGNLVPDEIMIKVLTAAMEAEPGDRRDFILDGFPRTVRQAELLDRELPARGGRIAAVILLEASRDVLVQRLAGRRVCRLCGATYHVVNIPPRREGHCDRCGGELVQRPDDNEATVLNRLEVYERQTAELIGRYQKTGGLRRVDSAQPLEDTVAEIRALIDAGLT